MIKSSDGEYEYIRATVCEDGIQLAYQCPELNVVGSDFIDDETASGWSDDEVRKVVGSWLGVTGGRDEIEVLFD